MEMIVSLLAFGATFLLVMGVATFLRPRVAGRRLARLGSAGTTSDGERESLILKRDSNAVVRAIGRLGQSSAANGEAGPLRQSLIHAGYRGQAAPAVFYGLRLVLALALPSLMLLLPIAWKLPRTCGGHTAPRTRNVKRSLRAASRRTQSKPTRLGGTSDPAKTTVGRSGRPNRRRAARRCSGDAGRKRCVSAPLGTTITRSGSAS